MTFTVVGSGAGAPALSISPTALDFAGVIVNQQSPSQTVTLSAANAAVNLQGVDLSSSAFVLNNQCATDLAAGAQCSISVFFQPATLGTATGTIAIRDNTAGSPHVLQLQGQGSHFVLVPATGSGQVVAAGQSANFSLGLQSLAATNETVSVSCSVAPPLSACTLSQSSFPLTGSVQTLTVTVPTAAHSEMLRLPAPVGPLLQIGPELAPQIAPQIAWSFGVLGTIFLALLFFRPNSLVSSPSLRLRHALSAALLIAVATGMISCSGGTTVGGGGTPQPGGGGGAGTPGGPYVVTITGTSSNSANPPQTVQLPFTTN